MRIAAGCTVYNSWDIVALSIGNLVAQGIRDFLVIDHRSAVAGGPALAELFTGHATIRVARKDTRPFHQGRLMTLLALEAFDTGFDAFLPFDADEFWGSADVGSGLLPAVTQWMCESRSPALRVPETDFVQRRDVESFTAAGLATASYRAWPRTGDVLASRTLIERGDSYLSRAPSAKVLVRRPAEADRSSWCITEGNHDVRAGQPDRDVADNLVIRHLPFRSRSALAQRAEQGRGRDAAGQPDAWGWQNRRLVGLPRAGLDAYWAANSWAPEGLPGGPVGPPGARLTQDLSLARVQEGIDSLGIDFDGFVDSMAVGSTPSPPSGTSTPDGLLQRLFDLSVDVPGPNEAEAARLVVERDRATEERQAVLDSRTWRSMGWYRRLRAGRFRARATPRPAAAHDRTPPSRSLQ